MNNYHKLLIRPVMTPMVMKVKAENRMAYLRW